MDDYISGLRENKVKSVISPAWEFKLGDNHHHFQMDFMGFLVIQMVSLVAGHGNMVIPFTWHDTEQLGMEVGAKNPGCVIEELPDHDEDNNWPTIHGRKVCQQYWFTNHTYIMGEPTLPEDMIGPGGHETYPWYSPGTAPVFSPCGTYGGNPVGCNPSREEKYGDCCQGNSLDKIKGKAF